MAVVFLCDWQSRAEAPPDQAGFLHDPHFRVGPVVAADDFAAGLGQWSAEIEKGGTVTATGGELAIDVPGGCTLWFRPLLSGPILVEYEATVIGAGGPNDRVSDLNCFWMARDVRSPGDILATRRFGIFADYDELKGYYVGQGGNGNRTTRFRRYVGIRGDRPLRPGDDLGDPQFLLTPNRPQRIQLVACGSYVAYYRDGIRLFALRDPQPYTSGWFALRTVKNHLTVRRLRVYRLNPLRAPD